MCNACVAWAAVLIFFVPITVLVDEPYAVAAAVVKVCVTLSAFVIISYVALSSSRAAKPPNVAEDPTGGAGL